MTTQWEYTGNEWAVQMLQKHIAGHQVRHAYLFTGPTGTGRGTLASCFAQALLCPQPTSPGIPCGTCRTCLKVRQEQYPDLTVVRRSDDSTQIKIDQIRELQHTLSLSPYQSKYRVALLLRLHEASVESQNALLKTLEEAPEKVILLVTADSPESLLATIVSRCEILRLRPMAVNDLEHVLLGQYQIGASQAHLLAHLSGGRTGTALAYFRQPELLNQRATAIEWAGEIFSANRRRRFSIAEEITGKKTKELTRQALSTWLSVWRDIMLASAIVDDGWVNVDMLEKERTWAGKLGLSASRQMVNRLEEAIGSLDANVNPRLLIETLLLDWPKI
ncbi:MAG TPA: hypothetical protein VN376_08040 [Longilinea sp.]|nr:hypothetical protein [Longilinea sp.]